MAAALTVLLIGCLLQTALCGQFKTIIPQTIEVLRGSCVTIPCSYDVEDTYNSRLDETCRALWKYEQTVVFDSSNPQSSAIRGELKGDLTRKDCTTTLNNLRPEHSKEYFLRVQCDNFGHNFVDQKLHISVTDVPPTPTLTPSTLKVEEGTSVNLKCSAPAPCLSHPPALTWSSSLAHIQESLQENLDRTKVQTSVLTFTASHLHHRLEISCTAVYHKQDGSSQSVSTSLTADISWSSQFITFIPQTLEVLSGSCVTIHCSFDVEDKYTSKVDETCRALWKNDQGTVVFNSRTPQTRGHLTGNLKNRDCTTTLNNMRPENSRKYFFRLECDNGFEYDFITRQVDISVKDVPPTPTLTPSTLKVEEGTSVSLKCSAPAPCLSHPPALTWTSSLGHIQESLQENLDRTKVQTSVLTFTASHLHHGKKISCTAVYNKQDGSSQSVSTSLTADISWSSQFKTFMPQTIEVLSGSCVTIPCSFGVEDTYKSSLDETCRALWKSDLQTVVFDSRTPQARGHLTGNLTGNLKNGDCTTTLNNMRPENSKNYFFRLECDGVKYDFFQEQIHISVKDVPPTPTLTPSTLKVEEGTSVSLKCSAPAPCLSHPPALTWTSSLGHIQDSLQQNQGRTKVQTSVMTFTASHLHHGKIISCTAVYNKQDGRSQSVSTSLTADVSYPPKNTTVSVSPSGPVPENSRVTLTCSSTANPAVKTYTWYRADGGQEVVMGTGNVLDITASEVSATFFCKAENDVGAGRSNTRQIEAQYSPKHTTVSVSPSGPVPEDTDVTLTCSSAANPAVKKYTWYRADGGQETVMGTGHVLNIKASRGSGPFFCKAENAIGSGRSIICRIDVHFAPQILSSHDCIQTADQLNCSCETVGNPPPALQWYLDGLPVNHSDRFAISSEPLNVSGLRSIITVSQPQQRDLSTLLCHSSNSLGSTTQRFFVYSLEPHGLEQCLGPYSGLLLMAGAGVSLCVNVLFAIYVVFLCKARKSVKPKEEDGIYMNVPEFRKPSP